MQERRIFQNIIEDLQTKMVLLSGPRQIGKTTLAEKVIANSSNGIYYSWDDSNNRKTIIKNQLNESKRLWVFDELHKYKKWRNWLKGAYDLHKNSHQILVTGSAKLNVYSYGGDSLQGRYFAHRLHPFTLSELIGLKLNDYGTAIVNPESHITDKAAQEALMQLLLLGGFPEPLLSASEKKANRWRLSYGKRLIEDDIRTIEQIQQVELLELLFDRLGEVVGNLLSINRLSKDLEVAHQTVSKWIKLFVRMYVAFQVAPWGPAKIRAIKKEQKLYLWDWPRVELPGARLENLLALHLLRLVHWFEDIEGEEIDLRYFKDVDGHEVDFILMKKRQPWIAIEVKSSEQELDNNLKYFLERQRVPYAFQLHLKGMGDYRVPNINGAKVRIMPLFRFLQNIP
jgi:uncharacterized protein